MNFDSLEISLFSSYLIDKIINKSITNVEIFNNTKKKNVKEVMIPRPFKILNTEYIDIENEYNVLQRSKTWQECSRNNLKKLLLQHLSQSNDNLLKSGKIYDDIIDESTYIQPKYLKIYIDIYFNRHLSILKTQYGEEIIGKFLKNTLQPPSNIFYIVKYLEENEWINLRRLKYKIMWNNIVSGKCEITHFNIELRNVNKNIEFSIYNTFGKGRMIRFEKGYYYIKRWIFNFAD
uniref:Uncharacterized protein n=1 Tax=Strongyloides stercoralis TaxID=6248 RepID=A0A0K0DVV8_STRER